MAFAAFSLRLKVRRIWIPTILTVVYITCVLSATYAQSPASNLPNPIKIGITISIPPIQTGFCKAFKQALETELKLKYPGVYVQEPAGNIVNYHRDQDHPRYQALIENKIDIECGTNSESSEELIYKPKNTKYRNILDFSDPFYTTSVRLLLKKGLAEELNDLNGEGLQTRIKNLRIGVISGTTTEWLFKNAKTSDGESVYNYTVIKLNGDNDAKYREISNRLENPDENSRIDALASDGIILKSWLETKKFSQKQYVISPQRNSLSLPYLYDQKYVLVSRKNPKLLSIVNDALKEIALKEETKLKEYENRPNPTPTSPSPLPSVTPSPSLPNTETPTVENNSRFDFLKFLLGLLIVFIIIIIPFILRMIKKFMSSRTTKGQQIKPDPAQIHPPPVRNSEILSFQQKRRLQAVLIEAFPSVTSLERMLSFGLNKNLRVVAGEGSLEDIVFKLIQTAHAQGWLEDLIRAAYEENPGNLGLRAFCEELFGSL